MKILLATFFVISTFYVVKACVSCTPPTCNTAPCNVTIGCGCYQPLVTVNLFGATVTKYAKCFFGREDYDDIPEEVKDEELALEMLTMEAFELCKSGEENCVTLEDIENCKETLGHFINENDVHVPNEADFDEMDMNKDGEVCLEEWKEMKGKAKDNE